MTRTKTTKRLRKLHEEYGLAEKVAMEREQIICDATIILSKLATILIEELVKKILVKKS